MGNIPETAFGHMEWIPFHRMVASADYECVSGGVRSHGFTRKTSRPPFVNLGGRTLNLTRAGLCAW